MSDLILLHGMEVEALIGVYDWERHAPRPLVLDLELSVDLHAAATSDRVQDTVDYAAVAACVTALCQREQPQLLEALAGRIARALLAEFATLTALTLTLHKPGILPNVRDVAIRLSRARSSG
ncbi:MAG: dihydroneopterin aldolase [Polycyclovorans sp.]|jgi:7,8-dihydroneopterin aldolase/epimerase/oxygenase|nr:dihydroneopterin aldolase [Gammaproteobacteria bacterium]MDP1544305.1 dihydroneopterin aldolase [Polycyclovorans sp.]|tara:strand:+ start:5793 stop:6158 length:366 start_codon:yes stop_codon:yes gene_type:complete